MFENRKTPYIIIKKKSFLNSKRSPLYYNFDLKDNILILVFDTDT